MFFYYFFLFFFFATLLYMKFMDEVNLILLSLIRVNLVKFVWTIIC